MNLADELTQTGEWDESEVSDTYSATNSAHGSDPLFRKVIVSLARRRNCVDSADVTDTAWWPPTHADDHALKKDDEEEESAQEICSTNNTYEPIKVLGAGSYGQVSLFNRKSDGKLVAIKTAATIMDYFPCWADNNDVLLDEAQMTSTLSHPNIVRTLEVFGLPYHDEESNVAGLKWHMAMEYCELGTLFDAVKLDLPLRWIFDGFFTQMVHALVYLDRIPDGNPTVRHIHNDIKPNNVFLKMGPDGCIIVVLGDFGCASAVQESRNAPDYGSGPGRYFLDPDWQYPGWRITPAIDMFRIMMMCAWLANTASMRAITTASNWVPGAGKREYHRRIACSPELSQFSFLFMMPQNEFVKAWQSERRAARCLNMIQGGIRMLDLEGDIPTNDEVMEAWNRGRYDVDRAVIVQEANERLDEVTPESAFEAAHGQAFDLENAFDAAHDAGDDGDFLDYMETY